jgi:histidyl-tRNA synthetase
MMLEENPPAVLDAPDAYVVFGEPGSRQAWAAAERLRDAGFAIVLHAGGGSFKSQMKKADGSGARFAIILGETEVGAGKVSLKDLRHAGEQQVLDIDETISRLWQGVAAEI